LVEETGDLKFIYLYLYDYSIYLLLNALTQYLFVSKLAFVENVMDEKIIIVVSMGFLM
jgi:hypothetical protein